MTAELAALEAWIATQPPGDQALLRAATGLDRGMTLLPGPLAVGVAVSGGGDSIALLHLLCDAAPQVGFRLEAATVDHRLRPEAADEAAFVARVCAERGIPHRTLVWSDHPETGNLMQDASLARRRLLAAWARQRGLARVAMAHTSDDQAESFLMALARGTGLDGLCGMRRDWEEFGMAFTRPLLAVSREALRDYLRRHGHDWREDPTNEDDRFARARARKAMALLAPLGIVEGRLNETMGHLAQVRALLDQSLAQVVEQSVEERAGALFLRRVQYLDLPFELRRRLLIAIVRWMSGSRHPARADQIFALSMNLRDEVRTTLGGCQFSNDGTLICAWRELNAVEPAAVPGEVWDHRWDVEGPFAPGQTVAALGEAGLRHCPGWRETGIPRQVLTVTPAVWQGETLVAAPLAGLNAGFTARLCLPFDRFIVSH